MPYTLATTVLFLLLALPATVYAVSITDYGWSCLGYLFCGASTDAVVILTARVVAFVELSIIGVAVAVIMYGGVRMIISRGSEGKEAGKKAILYALIGLVLAILTSRIIQFVVAFLSAVS